MSNIKSLSFCVVVDVLSSSVSLLILLQTACNLVLPEEKTRIQRFVFEKDRKLALLGRSLAYSFSFCPSLHVPTFSASKIADPKTGK